MVKRGKGAREMKLNFSNKKQKKDYLDFELTKIKNIISECMENDLACIKAIPVDMINSLLKAEKNITKYLKENK